MTQVCLGVFAKAKKMAASQRFQAVFRFMEEPGAGT
jgi:hypothetical protein